MRGVFKLYLIFMVVNLFLELPPLQLGLYTYYGVQPLSIAGFPLWWIAVNGAMPIVAGDPGLPAQAGLGGVEATVYRRPGADGRRRRQHAAAGWPTWIALNSSDRLAVTTIAALCTFALGALMIWVVGLATAIDSPLRRSPALAY